MGVIDATAFAEGLTVGVAVEAPPVGVRLDPVALVEVPTKGEVEACNVFVPSPGYGFVIPVEAGVAVVEEGI